MLRYPFDGSASRNRRLGISPRKGKAAAEDLCRQGLLSRIDVQEIKGRRTLYEPTKDGKLFALSKGFHSLLAPDQHGGVEHRFWNDRIARSNKGEGWQVTLEVPIKGNGTVDQLVTKDGRAAVVEIETGKSRPGRTLRRNLDQGFSRVIIVATSDQALAVVEEQLQKEGLAGDGRVRVIKANAYSPDLLE